MRCGTVKNFNNVIIDDMRKNDGQHWYFLTPIKISEKTAQMKEATIQIAFPFIATNSDISEQIVIERLAPLMPRFENALLKKIRKTLLVPSFTFSNITFWANEKGERDSRKDFGQTRIHILNAQIVVKYRYSWFNCNC